MNITVENMFSIKYSTRLVILMFGIVIKIPLSRRGYLQCKNESKIWERYKHLNVLGRLYWEFGGIICMRRYAAVDVLIIETEEKKFIDVVVGIKYLIPEFDIDNCDLYRLENWGKSGDDYVLIDYGINEYISGLYNNK